MLVAITGIFAGGTAMFEAGILVFWQASVVLYAGNILLSSYFAHFEYFELEN